MRTALYPIALAILSCPANAQLISPAGYGTKEGNSSNTFPFYGSQFHYQQLHDDIRNVILAIKGISFRRDGISSTSSRGKTVTAALWMGHGDFSKLSNTFARNYDAAGRTQVVPSRKIALPNMPPKPATPPAAFTVTIPLTTTFVYLGTKALVWEYACTSSTSPRTYVMDALRTVGAKRGTYRLLGTGCVATGQTRNMRAIAYFATYRSPDRVSYYCYTNYGTKSAPAATLIGLTNPNLPFPICNRILYTDGAVASIPTTSNSTGFFNAGPLYTPWNQALAGLKIYSQTYTADSKMGPIKAAVSNGVESVIPTLGLKPGPFTRIFAYNDASATAGTIGSGYVLVTRFNK